MTKAELAKMRAAKCAHRRKSAQRIHLTIATAATAVATVTAVAEMSKGWEEQARNAAITDGSHLRLSALLHQKDTGSSTPA